VSDRPKQWLAAVPWDSVTLLNKALCQAQKMDPLTQAKGLEAARRLWEKSSGKALTLREAFRVCHDAHEVAPFTFNNGNTFAAVGRTLIEDLLKSVPPVEAQILRTTVCHYIVGLIDRRELEQVLRHLGATLNHASPPDAGPTPDPAPVPLAMPRSQGV